MLKLFGKYGLVAFCVSMLIHSNAQLGAPILNVDFGLGNIDPNAIGPSMSTGETDFDYSTELCPPAGHYTVARRVNLAGCFNDSWIPLSSDHTSDIEPGMDYGNMMIVNSFTTTGVRTLFLDTLSYSFCPGSEYEFSASVINLDRPSNCTANYPIFKLTVTTLAGIQLDSFLSAPLSYANPTFGYRFSTFRVPIVMPPGINALVLKITVLHVYAVAPDCGDDFAVDDIRFSAKGPKVAIQFADQPPLAWVKSFCFQDNSIATMVGTMDPYYTNPAYQWQQSLNNGLSWTDIPGANSISYSEQFSVSDTFLYRLRGAEAANISNFGCGVVSNYIKVEVDGIPSDFNATTNAPVCAGEPLELHATQGFASYLWTGPNGYTEVTPFPFINTPTLADSGMYYVQIGTLGGCEATDSVYVVIIGTDVRAGPDTAICKDETVQLQASQGTSYSWSPAEGLSNTSVRNPRARPQSTTTYTVTVTDTSGCKGTADVVVALRNNTAVKALFDYTTHLCRNYDSANFADRSNGRIQSWHWDFGNGQTSTLQDPPVQFYFIGDNTQGYVARLSVIDTEGCTDTAIQYINVAANCYTAVPTAFTPDGDGLNDLLYPLNAYKATELTFRVYNRYGQLVFETHDWTRKWDGTYKGTKLNTDTFIWMLEYLDAAKKKVFLKGTTVLIR